MTDQSTAFPSVENLMFHPFREGFCKDNDLFWDLRVSWYTNTPDFTECFQKTALVWGPCAFLWLMLPFQALRARSGRFRVKRWTHMSFSKLVLSVLLAVLSLVDIFQAIHIWNTVGLDGFPDVDIVEPIVKAATFILSTGYIFTENRRAKPSSGTLFVFWFLMLVPGLIRFRTVIEHAVYYGIDGDFRHVTQMIYFPLLLAQFMLSCFADYFPERESGERNPCPEQFSSVPNRATFWWMSGLIYRGWKKPLVQTDLWDLGVSDKTTTHEALLAKYWKAELDRAHRSQPDFSTPEAAKVHRKPYDPSLTKAIVKTIAGPFLLTALFRILTDGAVFIAPQVLRLLIAFVSDKRQEAWKGFLYVFLMFLGAFSQIILANSYFFLSQRCGMHIRSALVSSVYQKALKLSNASKRTSTVGEIVNLMAVDSQKFSDLIGRVQILWSAPLQISLAVYFLWQVLGPSTLAGLGVMMLLIPINSVIIRTLRKLQISNMKNKDNRIKLMNEILSGMKILKLYAWEASFQEQVLATRELELATLIKAAYINAVSTFISILSPFMVAIVTFTTYVMSDTTNVLDATKAFVSLSLFNILRQPVNNLPDVIAAVIQAQVSIMRLTKFFRNGELDPTNVRVISSSAKDHTSGLTITNGSFSWGGDEMFTLKNIDLDVPEGQFVAVVGHVGAGKSSLCCAMLGLMEKTAGDVTRKGTVAYVSQQAWIQNLSLKENIVFGNEFNETLYQKVLDACALRADLDLLPAGDLTEIGEKGINLSGGQKQRVSLARAIYSGADVYFLDDPLSAVDAHVGKHIFENVISEMGMLKGKTRILVTHGIGYLPKTDQIVVLESGQVSEVGTYKQLLHNKGPFAKFLRNYLTEEAEALEIDDPEAAAIKDEILSEVGITPPFERAASMTSHTSGASLRRVRRVVSRQDSKPISLPKGSIGEKNGIPLDAIGKVKKDMKGKLVEKEHSETGGVKWTVYFMYLKHLTAPIAAAIFGLFVLSNASGVGTNIWLGEWSKDASNESRRNSTEWRDFRLGIYGAIGTVQGIFVLSASLVLTYGQNMASRKQHEGMLRRVMHAPMTFFDTTPLGRIINRFSKDIDTVDSNIPMHLRAWLNCAFNVISTIVVICLGTPIFATVILPLGVVYYLIQRFFIPTGRQLKRLESVSRSPIYSHFQESLTGSSLIIATDATDRFVLQNEKLMDRNNASFFPNIASQRWLAVRVELIGNCVTVFAGLFAVIGRDQEWGISPENIGLSVTYALSVTATLNWLVRVASDLEANIVSVERIKEYSEIAIEAPWVIEDKRPDVNWPQEGVVEFNKYQTRYRPELDLVLKGINCHIERGEKVGIVGRTGAGKSSLTLALFRIIEGTDGAIVIDNLDISTIGLHDLRSRLTIIPQEPVLFSGTLRLNLDPFMAYTDGDVWNALENSHLKRFVSSLPNGLQHMVAEGGDNLSVGQRQLICLARALLRKTKILVLDEATAAIDLETDTLIQTTIREKFADCTVLTIAHRLNTIMDSTRVMVLDQGVVKEFASPSALLQDQNSLFYGLAKSANLAPQLEASQL